METNISIKTLSSPVTKLVFETTLGYFIKAIFLLANLYFYQFSVFHEILNLIRLDGATLLILKFFFNELKFVVDTV